MEIPTIRLDHVLSIHSVLALRRHHRGMGWWYRGQSDERWELIPKAGREEYLIRPEEKRNPFPDLGRFNAWLDAAYPFARDLPKNDYEALAYAQHHGLATRLLDWTSNPLVAAFFAARELPGRDGAIFCYFCDAYLESSKAKLPLPGSDQFEAFSRALSGRSPTSQEGMAVIEGLHGRVVLTRAMDGRMLNQRGAFTLHWPPERPIEVAPHAHAPEISNLARIVIPASLKPALLEHLDDYGVNDSFVYPDVDGVSSWINWETRDIAATTKAP